jgi:hypothetical protein
MFALQRNPEAPISIFVISCTSTTSTCRYGSRRNDYFSASRRALREPPGSTVTQTARCGTKPESCVAARIRVLCPGRPWRITTERIFDSTEPDRTPVSNPDTSATGRSKRSDDFPNFILHHGFEDLPAVFLAPDQRLAKLDELVGADVARHGRLIRIDDGLHDSRPIMGQCLA